MTDALWSIYNLFLMLIIAVLGYALIVRQAARAVHPARLRMAALGEDILARDIPKEQRRVIESHLNSAFSPWPAVGILVAMPFFFIYVWLTLSILRKKHSVTSSQNDQAELERLWLLSAWAANPIIGSIAVIEAAFLLFITLLVFGQAAAVIKIATKVLPFLNKLAGSIHLPDPLGRMRA